MLANLLDVGAAVAPAANGPVLRSEVSENIGHPKEVVEIRMGQYDIFQSLDISTFKKAEESIVHTIEFGEVTIYQNPSAAGQTEQHGVPVPAREQVTLHGEGRFRSGGRQRWRSGDGATHVYCQ